MGKPLDFSFGHPKVDSWFLNTGFCLSEMLQYERDKTLSQNQQLPVTCQLVNLYRSHSTIECCEKNIMKEAINCLINYEITLSFSP